MTALPVAGTTGTSLSTNITTIAANSWIAGIYVNDNGGTVTATGSAVIIGTTFSNPGIVTGKQIGRAHV